MKLFTGLVLIGGKSSRMGTDKSRLIMDKKYLYQIAADKLIPYCHRVFLSVNNQQAASQRFDYPVILDNYPESGPVGAILSCFENVHPSILVLAADMVSITSDDITALMDIHTNDKNNCTMFYNDRTNHYEPLLSLWEKTMYSELKKYFDEGGRSLQKFLNQQSINLYYIKDYAHFKNVNTPEDWLSQ